MKEKILLSEVDEIIAGGPDENEHVALCSYRGHEGIIDVDGNVIVPFLYSSINGFIWDESGRLAVVNDEGLLGHVDVNGKEVIPCQFPFQIPSEPLCFHEDRFAVCDKNGLIGFINPQGEVVIGYQFHGVSKFQNGLCPVMNANNKWGYIDRDGSLRIDYLFNKAYCFKENGTAQVLVTVKKLYLFTEEKLVNINKKGQIIG